MPISPLLLIFQALLQYNNSSAWLGDHFKPLSVALGTAQMDLDEVEHWPDLSRIPCMFNTLRVHCTLVL